MRAFIKLLTALVAFLTVSSALTTRTDSVKPGSLIKRAHLGAICPKDFVPLGPIFAHGRIPDRGEFAACCPLTARFVSLSVYYEDPQKLYSDWPFWTALGHPFCCLYLDGAGCRDNAVSVTNCDKGWEVVGTPGWGDNDIAVCHKIGTPGGIGMKRETIGESTSISDRRIGEREVPSSDLSSDVPPKAHDWTRPPFNSPRANNIQSFTPNTPTPDLTIHARQAEQADTGCNPGYHATFLQPDPLFHLAYTVCCPTGWTGGAMWENGEVRCCSDCNKKSTCAKWIDGVTQCIPKDLQTTASGVRICRMYQPGCTQLCSNNGCTKDRLV